jgi:hypothetical protein
MKVIKLTEDQYKFLFSVFGSAIALEKNDSFRHAICAFSAHISLTTETEIEAEAEKETTLEPEKPQNEGIRTNRRN